MGSNEGSWNAFSSLLLRHTVTVGAYTTYSTNELHPNTYKWPSPQLHGLQAYKRLIKYYTTRANGSLVVPVVSHLEHWWYPAQPFHTTNLQALTSCARGFTYKFHVYFMTHRQPTNCGLWDHIQKQQVQMTCTVCTKCRACECKVREEISRE